MQPRYDPRRQFRGPFRGLNTKRPTNELPPGWAQVARNIVLYPERIGVRAPWQFWSQVVPLIMAPNTRILCMYTWRPPALGHKVQVLAVTRELSGPEQLVARNLYGVDRAGTATLLLQLDQGSNPVDFIRYGDFVYIPTENGWVKTNGLNNAGTLRVGIPVINVSSDVSTKHVYVTGTLATGAPPAGQYIVQYALTWYDQTNKVEGNAGIGPMAPGLGTNGVTKRFFRFIGANDDPRVTFNILPPNGMLKPSDLGISHVRIYRRKLTSFTDAFDGQLGFQLLAEVPALPGSQFIDNIALTGFTLSSDTAGPFAPSRNGIPHGATCAVLWKSRILSNHVNQPGKIFFSDVGNPDAVDANDFLDVSGCPDDRVTGLARIGNQVLVGKRGGDLTTIGGDLAGPTNLTNALGAEPLDSNEQIYHLGEEIGPVQHAANGFIVAGVPSRAYFAADSGFYVFDGISPKLLSDPIQPTWDKMLGPPASGGLNRGFTYADNRHDGVIYIIPSFSQEPANFALAYSYRTDQNRGEGGWSTIDGGTLSLQSIGAPGGIPLLHPVCVASTVEYIQEDAPITTDPIVEDLRAPFVVWGLQNGIIARDIRYSVDSDVGDPDDANEQRVPQFEWTGGDLPLARGMEALVRWCKWFFADLGVTNPMANLVDCTVRVDQWFAPTAQLNMARQGSGPTWSLAPVRVRGSTYRIEIIKSDSFLRGWQEKAGITGWEMDTELVGQR